MAKTQETKHVYAVIRTDYHDMEEDAMKEGHANLISIHASLDSANAAAIKHLEWFCEDEEFVSPKIHTSNVENGTKTYTVNVNEEDMHSFSVGTYKQELVGGKVLIDAHSTAAVTQGKANTAVEGSRKTKAAPEPDSATDSDPDDEEEDEPTAQAAAAKIALGPNSPTNVKCLRGLTFLITGTLEGYTRPTAEAMIKSYGGKIGPKMCEELDYVVLGVQAGPKKLEEIKKFALATLNQQDLYELIERGGGGKVVQPESKKRAAAGEGGKKGAKKGKKA